MPLKSLLDIKPITLQDKEIITPYLKTADSVSSDFSFTNLFMWQKSYNIRYAICDGVLYIFSGHGNSPETVSLPDCREKIKAVLETASEYFINVGKTPFIRIIGSENAEKIKNALPESYYFTEDINNNDYVYKIENLISLSGNKYHQKRNHINRFKASYDYEYRRLTAEDANECFEMFQKWSKSKGTQPGSQDELPDAVSTLLFNMGDLDIVGGGLFVNGEMVAFSFGEVLNREKSMVVIHLEHANTEYNGSFPTMNMEFLKNEWSGFEYVNREAE